MTLFDFLSLKNNVNVPSKSNMQKKIVLKNYFFAGILKVNEENSKIRFQDPDPDPLVRGMDPRIRIHTKMSWIRNTGRYGTYIDEGVVGSGLGLFLIGPKILPQNSKGAAVICRYIDEGVVRGFS